MQIGILEGDSFSRKALDILSSLGTVTIYDGTELDRFIAAKDVLFVRLGYHIDEAFIQRATALRYLCSPTTGHTHIDEQALSRRGISLISLRGERAFLDGIRATPEHTLGLILALLRNYRHAFLSKNNPLWDRERYRGEEVMNLSVGILGLGRVGKIVAAYLRALGAKISFFDLDQMIVDKRYFRVDSLEEVIVGCRMIVLCASYETGTDPLLQARHIEMLKGKYLVNTARGELIDEDALLEAIRRDWFAGLAIDVIQNEYTKNRLQEWLDATEGRNVIITPHIGGATFTSMWATEEFIVEKLKGLLRRSKNV